MSLDGCKDTVRGFLLECAKDALNCGEVEMYELYKELIADVEIMKFSKCSKKTAEIMLNAMDGLVFSANAKEKRDKL